MTFGTYAQRQLFFEPELNTPFVVAYSQPDESGVLRHIRVRYIITDNFTDDCTIYLRVVDYYDTTEVIETSSPIVLSDFTLPTGKQFRQGWIRFDFSGTKTIAKENTYRIEMLYNCTDYDSADDRFLMFAVDYPFRTYDTSGSTDPFTNCYIEHQIFTERLYDDFVVR
jgi:hypothetical protein